MVLPAVSIQRGLGLKWYEDNLSRGFERRGSMFSDDRFEDLFEGRLLMVGRGCAVFASVVSAWISSLSRAMVAVGRDTSLVVWSMLETTGGLLLNELGGDVSCAVAGLVRLRGDLLATGAASRPSRRSYIDLFRVAGVLPVFCSSPIWSSPSSARSGIAAIFFSTTLLLEALEEDLE